MRRRNFLVQNRAATKTVEFHPLQVFVVASVGSGPQGMERNQKRTSWGPPDIQELEV